MERTTFTKEKITVMEKISNEVIRELKFESGQTGDDFMNDILTKRLSAFVYANTLEERELVYYCPRPTFFDWLFRRTKKAVWNFKVKDLLLNAPATPNTLRIYEIERN
jgi:hypothetical protein